MTDDRLEKVRKEVERMHNLLPVMDGDNISVNYADRICTTLEMYIDSLQEEPKFKIGQTITDPDNSTFTFHINKIEDGKYIESDDAWVLIKDADEEYQLVEEPVSEDLETEIDNIREKYYGLESLSAHDVIEICEHFFKFGANWRKEQMMKDSINAIIDHPFSYDYPNIYTDYRELRDFAKRHKLKDEDKVKVIIIKYE